MNAVDTNILIYLHDPRDPIESGITTLYSEDFSGVGPIGNLNVVNPFNP